MTLLNVLKELRVVLVHSLSCTGQSVCVVTSTLVSLLNRRSVTVYVVNLVSETQRSPRESSEKDDEP